MTAIGASEVLIRTRASQRTALILCVALGVCGLAGLVMGRGGELSPAAQGRADWKVAAEQVDEVSPLAFLLQGRYWGFILILSATIIYLIWLCVRDKPHAPPVVQPKPVVARLAPPPPIVFPALKLQGLVLNGNRSHAVINGTILFVGERIGAVRLAAVEADAVTVEMGGQTRVLRLLR